MTDYQICVTVVAIVSYIAGFLMLNYEEAKLKPITNYDILISKSPEELAAWLAEGGRVMVHPCNKPCGNKTASGYCATIACINPQFSNIGTAQYGKGVQKRIVTNADRIRAMTDEELAGLLERIRVNCANGLCGRNCPLSEICYSLAESPKGTLDYLKQEVTNTKEVINNSKT